MPKKNKTYTMKDLQRQANKEQFDVNGAPVKVHNQATGETYACAGLSYDPASNTVFVICNVPEGDVAIAPQA